MAKQREIINVEDNGKTYPAVVIAVYNSELPMGEVYVHHICYANGTIFRYISHWESDYEIAGFDEIGQPIYEETKPTHKVGDVIVKVSIPEFDKLLNQ